MVQLNGFGVQVLTPSAYNKREFQRNGSYYIALPNNTEYQIRLTNDNDVRADAYVRVDGQSIGGWVLYPYSSVTIERHGEIARKLTFFSEISSEALESGITPGLDENGLISVTFKPQKKETYMKLPSATLPSRSVSPRRAMSARPSMQRAASPSRESRAIMATQSVGPAGFSPAAFSSGVTLLGGDSLQRFVTVPPLREDQIDQSNITTITIRMVVEEHATRIPPRIDYPRITSVEPVYRPVQQMQSTGRYPSLRSAIKGKEGLIRYDKRSPRRPTDK